MYKDLLSAQVMTHDFLAEEVIENYNNKNYYNAWRRRFITVKFTSAVDENPIPVRFDYTSATDALKAVLTCAIICCKINTSKICSANIM